MAVCVSFIVILAVTAGWLFVASYLDFQVAQLRRSEKRSGQSRRPPLVLERTLKLPWGFSAWLISGVAVLCLASFSALLHLGLLVVLSLASAVFLGVIAFLDWKQLQMWATGGTAGPSACLYGVHGEYAGQRVQFGGSDLTIGRGQWNTLPLAERFASQNHARIYWRNGHYYVQDLGSSHGTYLNEQRVEAALLHDGDKIRISGSVFEFHGSAPALAAKSGQVGAPAWWLDCLRGEHAGYRFALNSTDLAIGRGHENALMLADPTVSRYHARISYVQGRFYLQDLGSQNGTLLNGQPIAGSVLRDADCITIGSSVFEFHSAGTR